MKKTYLIPALLITGSFVFAQAPLLIEDFNYPVGDPLTAHDWNAHSGGTTNPVLVTSPGLTFAGYVGSNIGLAAGVNNTGQDVNKLYTAQTSGTVYVSFLVNATANTGAGGYFFHLFDPTASTAFRARTYIKPKTGKMLLGFSFNASSMQDSSGTLLNFGETYLFVAKYKIVDGVTNDIASLFVFKAGDNFATEPATPTLGPLTATLTVPADPTSPLGPDIIPTGIALRQFESAERITVDGFRVKTKWELTEDVLTGINDEARQQIGFYPNPVTNGYLNLTLPENSEKQVDIYTVIGKNVLSQNTSANKIDIKNLIAGVYIMKVTVGGKTMSSKLIVK
ncbi:MAG: T9SS type A sorting domain-containing protein [Ferruginibacter sp.]